MSGQPSPDGVAKLREIAAAHRKLDSECNELTARILNDTKRLESLKIERRVTGKQIVDQLREMDCASDGNFGWEGRIVWMLSEFASHVAPDAKPTEDPINAGKTD